MKVVSFNYLNKPKKPKKVRIYCVGKVFKPIMLTMGFALVMLVVNLLVQNFFINVEASVQNFIENFINIFSFL